MYNYAELTAMSEADVAKIAESMGLKKHGHADKDSVIFQILDKQAADHASTAMANGNADRERPKRERISRKAEKTATARPDEASAVENVTTPPGQDKQVRTRGRKPKKAQAAPAVENKPLEMPRMDGHTLCRQIKEDTVLRRLPVILFSSIITDKLRHKGEDVAADDQVAKPGITYLANRAIKLIEEYGEAERNGTLQFRQPKPLD